MNEIVERTQMEYREYRELYSFSIFDIETKLIQLANEGRVWIIKEMKDLSMIETTLITHLLCETRELQIYDLSFTPQ